MVVVSLKFISITGMFAVPVGGTTLSGVGGADNIPTTLDTLTPEGCIRGEGLRCFVTPEGGGSFPTTDPEGMKDPLLSFTA